MEEIEIEQEAKAILFEKLRNAKLFSNENSIENQSKILEIVSGWFYEVASVKGGVGYTAFSNSLKVGQVLSAASRNLDKAKQLSEILRDFEK